MALIAPSGADAHASRFDFTCEAISCTSMSSGVTSLGNALGKLKRDRNSGDPPGMDAMPALDLATAHGFLARIWRLVMIGFEGIGS